MKPATTDKFYQRAFTLIELMFAMSVGLVVAGSIVMLLVQSGLEQRKGLVHATLEEKSYILQSKISTALRSVSATQGVTPDYSTGDATNGFATINFSSLANGVYTPGKISFDAVTGRVLYTPNNTVVTSNELWMTNSPMCQLTYLRFNTTYNLDGSQNSSLVNVLFKMDDNGYSMQKTNVNLASIWRSFAIQIRND